MVVLKFLWDKMLVIGLAVGLVIAGFMVWKRREKLKLRSKSQYIVLMLVYLAVGPIAVITLAMLENLMRGNGLAYSGFSIYGIYFFVPGLLLLYAKAAKKQFADVLDVYAVASIPTLMLMRLNCISTGCCRGLIIPGTTFRYPTREAEIVYDVLMMIVLLRWEKKNPPKGTVFPLAMILYGCFRFVCEFFRESEGTRLIHLPHIWSVLCIIVGISFFVELRNRADRKKNKASAQRRKKA